MSRQYPPFQCFRKYIYIPMSGINTDIESLDRYIYSHFSVVEQELLLNCGYVDSDGIRHKGYEYLLPDDFEYVIKAIHPRFCITKNNMGLDTQYLIDKLRLHNSMICMNEYAEAFSILIWHYDGDKIYISSVCSDQDDDKARGSAGALINDLIKAASKTNEIKHVFLDSLTSAIPNYKNYNFKETGNTPDGLTEMILDLPAKSKISLFNEAASSAKPSAAAAAAAVPQTRAYYEIYRNTIDKILEKAVQRKYGVDFVSTYKPKGHRTIRKKPTTARRHTTARRPTTARRQQPTTRKTRYNRKRESKA